MFSKELRTLTLSGNFADVVFPNIYAQDYRNDTSFRATLRALASSRLDRDSSLTVARHVYLASQRSFSSTVNRPSSFRDLFRTDSDTVKILNFRAINPPEIDECMRLLSESAEYVPEGFSEAPDLHVFFQSKTDARFYINKEARKTVVILKTLDFKIWHLLQSVIPRLAPWVFEGKELDDEERSLLVSLGKGLPQTYESLIEGFADRFDFRSQRTKQLLSGIEASASRRMVDNTQTQIDHCEHDIEVNIARYKELLENRTQLYVLRAGYEAQAKAQTEGEILDFFLRSKNLEAVSSDQYDGRFSFIVRGYLTNWDPDMYESYVDNPDSCYWLDVSVSTSSPLYPTEARRKLMDAIFGAEPKIKVKMCAFYTISLAGSVESCRDYDFSSRYEDCIPNTHLNRYNCFGSYKIPIEKCLRDGNYVGAITQCIVSATSMNVGEKPTIPYFLQDILTSTKKVLELPDGTSCTPAEALLWLRTQEPDAAEPVQPETDAEPVQPEADEERIEEVPF